MKEGELREFRVDKEESNAKEKNKQSKGIVGKEQDLCKSEGGSEEE